MKESLYITGFGTVVAVCMGCAYLIICGIIRGMKILKYRILTDSRYDECLKRIIEKSKVDWLESEVEE